VLPATKKNTLKSLKEPLHIAQAHLGLPESLQNKSIDLQVGKKTMNEIVIDFDLEIGGANK
jgi:hypothetical protein